jgi:predicted dehydrogenase
MPVSNQVSRRGFLARSAGCAAVAAAARVMIVPAWAASPNEKLNIAIIGVAGRGAANLGGVASENIVTLCDVDKNNLNEAAKRFPQAKLYSDFRKMLPEIEKQIDAVVVSTPDHTHAAPGVMAMKMGKHCYCEKPLTHSVYEARTMAETAKAKNLATQMGTQIHAEDNYRRVVELVQANAIGAIREVHVWSGAGYSGGKRPTDTPPVPANLDWDLWLGPAPFRPYHPAYAPFRWRGWADFGTGGLGDFFCHFTDLPFWALKLRHPTSVSAEGPEPDPDSCPPWLVVQYEFPARENLPAVKLTWYNGGKRPPIQKEQNLPDWGSGVLFVGEKGMILADYGRRMLLPEAKFAGFQPPPQTIPKSVGHHREWIEACKTGSPTTCNFDYSGALSEAALLGNVAYRAGEKLQWDAASLKATNCPAAEKYIRRAYREGWTL